MKHKKIVAALLCLCLLAALPVPAQAKTKGCGCGKVVQVVVMGIFKPLRYNEGGAIEIPALLGHLLMDNQGNSILPATMNWRIDPAQNHAKQPEYEFQYDYRIDAFKAAAQLNGFIEALRKHTGHEKIALIGKSYGTNVILAYLKNYGSGRLDTLILSNGAFQGATLAVDLMLGRHGLKGPALLNFMESMGLAGAASLLRKTPLARLNLPMTLLNLLLGLLLRPMLIRMPSAWTMIPGPDFHKVRPLLDNNPDFAYLRKFADTYQKEVQKQVPRLLRGAMDAGVKVAIVSSYGKAPIPLLKNTAHHCDTVVDTAYSSGGATVAPIGKTLPKSKSPYRSPDGIIDAATCILPDHTWFIKDNDHFTLPAGLQHWIVYRKTQPTVRSHAGFPQFMRILDNGSVKPLT